MSDRDINWIVGAIGIVIVGAILYKWYKDRWWSPGGESSVGSNSHKVDIESLAHYN